MLASFFRKQVRNNVDNSLQHEAYFNDLRKREYGRLDREKHVYLDYTGGNLYAKSQVDQHLKELEGHTFGNPHSTNPTSQYATKRVEEARNKVLDFFNAHNYYCIFTQNASMALNIVGESYPFGSDGHFLLFTDNHNSVNGIREYCLRQGGVYQHVPMNYDDLTVSETDLMQLLSASNARNKLFAFPAQSNVSGIKHDLSWIGTAQELGWDVLLDAAAFVPTSKLDLSLFTPDFVSVSFYKIFGYPTGIGCLLVKKSSFEKLQKKWFAGGTVRLASAITPFHFLTDNHERFENGTVNYLDIPALTIGLNHIERIGMQRISERIASLITYLYSNLKELKHSNGEPQLDIFGLPGTEKSGGTMIMCFRNPDGSKIGFEAVEELANARGISIRSGCFCNPGLDETNNCLSTQEISNYFTGRSSGDYYDMIKTLQKMRGATRVSVGIATTKADLDTFIGFTQSFRDKHFSSSLI